MDKISCIKYSESFKKQVVTEVMDGKYSSCFQASKAYGIRGRETVKLWCRKYGNECPAGKQVRVYSMKEEDELKAAKEEIKALKLALADAHMEKVLGDSFLEIACEHMNIDPSDFKKKHGLKRSAIQRLKRPQ